jgi:hypothetical protein
MATKQYILEINVPGEKDLVEAVFESDTPFGAITVGDILKPGFLHDAPKSVKDQRVVKVVHILWQNDGPPKHKICIHTEEIE